MDLVWGNRCNRRKLYRRAYISVPIKYIPWTDFFFIKSIHLKPIISKDILLCYVCNNNIFGIRFENAELNHWDFYYVLLYVIEMQSLSSLWFFLLFIFSSPFSFFYFLYFSQWTRRQKFDWNLPANGAQQYLFHSWLVCAFFDSINFHFYFKRWPSIFKIPSKLRIGRKLIFIFVVFFFFGCSGFHCLCAYTSLNEWWMRKRLKDYTESQWTLILINFFSH